MRRRPCRGGHPAGGASREHCWQLKDEENGSLSIGTRVSALQAATLTLSYEPENGRVRLFEGSGTQGQLLDELKVRAGASLGSLTVSNAEGGDLALDRLDVRVVTYPQQVSQHGGAGE